MTHGSNVGPDRSVKSPQESHTSMDENLLSSMEILNMYAHVVTLKTFAADTV